ncbi:hypothetical protein IKF81_01630 [Candidatus Saccharibacteria bacterium]|nr:hypothetical protein [Candidatus Saccharibacteria bacterium]
MKLISLAKLGHRHLIAHKKQSLLSICSGAIFFGAMLGVVFLFEGMEHSFINNSEKISQKDIYVVSNSCTGDDVCLDYDAISAQAEKKSKQYNGELVGAITTYNVNSVYYNVVDEQYLENLIEINLDEYKKGTVFRIISLDQAEALVNRDGSNDSIGVLGEGKQKIYTIDEINELKSKVLGKQFTEAHAFQSQESEIEGILNSDSSSAEEIESLLGTEKEIDPLLMEKENEEADDSEETEENYETKTIEFVVAGIIGSAPNPPTISQSYRDIRIIDVFLNSINNDVAIPNILINRPSDSKLNYSEVLSFAKTSFSSPITKFTNLNDALDYYSQESCNLEQNIGKCTNYKVTELIGNRLQTKNKLDELYYLFNFDEIALLLIGISIVVFAFIRLIGENVRSIALYRSLGASSFDIFFIYFVYLLELCICTLLLSTIIGIGIAIGVSLKDSTSISAMLTSLYGRGIKSGILFALGTESLKIMLAIIIAAPICSILCLDQLSSKNIAKKIKQ